MKNTLRIKTLLMSTLLAVAVPTTIYAATNQESANRCEHHHGMKGHGYGDRHAGMPPFFKALNLSDAQKTQLKTIAQADRPAMRAQWKERHDLMQQMRVISSAEQFDANKAEQVANQLATLDKQRTLARAQKSHDMFAILTPEQRSKMEEMRQKHQEKFEAKKRMHQSKLEGSPNDNNGLSSN